MPDLDTEEFYDSDSSDNEENHSKLLTSVSQLDSTQRVKPAQRKEIASEVSEFNLGKGVPSGKNLVSVKELANVLGKKSNFGVISKKIDRVTKVSSTLPKPLEKVTEERLKRSVGYENVKKQLRKWDAIVEKNALRDHISFPLNNNSMKLQKSNEFLSQFKSATPLEEEIAKVLQQDVVKETEMEENEFPLTLQEMMEKRKELAQLRAKLSYKQAKAMRQSKIKSKKYHRLLKREKIRQQLKEFEILQKTDPEAALKKLSELDKTRAQERASLRHRNTGQWAKNLSVRAKYDVETRKVLAEQLKMSRELTQKVSLLDSSDDEEGGEAVALENGPQNQTEKVTTFGDNPWTLNVSEEVQDFVSGCKKYWEIQAERAVNEDTDKKEIKKQSHEDGRGIPNKQEKVINGNKVDEGNKEQSHEPCKEIPGKEEKVINDDESNEETKKENPESGREVANGGNTQECKKAQKTAKAQPEKVFKLKSPRNNSTKKSTPRKKESWVSIQPTSGVWVVTELEEKSDSARAKNSKRKAEDIDTLFEELDEKLMANAAKRIRRIEAEVKQTENKRKKREKKGKSRLDASLKNPNAIDRPDMDRGLLEEGEDIALEEGEQVVPEARSGGLGVSENKAPPTIDPQNFIQVQPKRLRTQLPENVTGGEEVLDDEKEQQMIIEEAFGGDDVMAEFQEKKAEEEAQKIEIETSLPGWGEWGGSGIPQTRRKKRLLVLNRPPRKDRNKKDLIINENENPNLRKHLVKEVPHPFKSVEAFEANIRAPVGRDWIPETAHQKLIQTQVETKLGTIIEPMSEEEIIRMHKASKSPYKGKKKSKT